MHQKRFENLKNKIYWIFNETISPETLENDISKLKKIVENLKQESLELKSQYCLHNKLIDSEQFVIRLKEENQEFLKKINSNKTVIIQLWDLSYGLEDAIRALTEFPSMQTLLGWFKKEIDILIDFKKDIGKEMNEELGYRYVMMNSV